MERSSLCRNLKQQHTINKSITNFKNLQEDYNKVNKGTSSWDFHNDNNNGINGSEEGDLMMASAGFSWPPRSYTCSFCKREFRSAQALGGHMNVHRRDRARLRQSPPTDHNNNSSCNNNPSTNHGQFPLLNLNLGPNPSLNPNPSLTSKFPHFTSTLLNQTISPLSANANKIRPLTTDLLKINVAEKGCDVVKKGEKSVRLDLGIGLISQNKEELDLELRLGYV